ncbi:DUF4345 family protein [Pseudaestuariivita rosea]|uniref:DUF4345 family protein n=1 Tax=Pseudaestuariivita rosea TaxID=2763263 RepID=UPI001F369A2A|nr:DUF4345 family protein [Pseudaestuariivita rosea]
MIDIINIVLALFSIALGLFGWLAPRYTMKAVDLQPGETTMGFSEIRAASGALFVGLGVGALFLATPAAYAMVGFAWGFASVGRMTSIILDGATRKKWIFFGCEIAVGVILIGINIW